MQVKLMGLHKVKATLAGGRKVTYFYAWRGGPRIDADPANKRAFAAEFFRLTRARDDSAGKGRLAELIRQYEASPAFTKRKASTQKGYRAAIDIIEAEFYDLPLSAVSEPGARRMFVEWRDSFADTPRKADLVLSVLARILSYGRDLEMIDRNPLERVGRLSEGTRRDAVWTDAQIAAFEAVAPPKMRLAMGLARWTGQRQGDLLRLTWTAYDGTHIKLRQGKTGKPVRIRVYSELKALLDATKREAVTILTTQRGSRPWTSDGFRASWAAVCEKAGVEGVTFHDLRGTFVTLAYRHHNAPIKEIAEITGHSERDAEAIIRKHYLAGDSVIERIEKANEAGRKV
jgi:integrase